MKINIIPKNTFFENQFFAMLAKIHPKFSSRAKKLVDRRKESLLESRAGLYPDYLPESRANLEDWKIDLPKWCSDQRNQMTGPADNAELCVKLLNSGSPGVMLDLEDSMANKPDVLLRGLDNVRRAISGELTYNKRGKTYVICTIIWN